MGAGTVRMGMVWSQEGEDADDLATLTAYLKNRAGKF